MLDVGSAYLVGKIADDSTEGVIHLVAATTASGTVASISRYVGLRSGLLFVLTRHGKDVTLPRFSQLDVTFTHPVVISVN